MIQKSSKKKLLVSFRELEQKKFFDTSKELKDPNTLPRKNIWILIRDNWKQVLMISILTDILFAFTVNMISEYHINSALKYGTRPKLKMLKDQFVSRPQISKVLKKILQPNEDQSYYHIICGEHGTGKTTLIRMEATNIGKGVIYVDIPSDFKNLGKAFGKAINLLFFEDISITALLIRKFLSEMDMINEIAIFLYQWRRVMKIFRHASKVYQKRYHKLPVIIYDNISQIVKENSKVLDILQDDAKDNADDREYIAVFISSEESVLQRMESRSAWSRADQPVIEISDLSKKESKDYITKRCTKQKKKEVIKEIKDEEINELYEIVGGRIVDLKAVIDKFLAGYSLKVIKQAKIAEVEKKFNSAQLLQKQLHHEVGKKVIKALIVSEELGFTTFMEYFDNYEDAGKVLEANIFTYHPAKNTISFQSRSVEFYIHEKADIFLK
ncbi:P-loop containing nucleoside triphosphate hydrolase protein [Glomus cerebriforme]|uniref:P-loop containing nucleoside triphosphate hydrolase protein n=1 Tax=Glomus cerebriforme TaxID=658196 RepID=A0A397T2C0_9GLOM|nr:P-loop containing nucleoside triphosphate hydrolase protein [Glomus cerebriforme]